MSIRKEVIVEKKGIPVYEIVSPLAKKTTGTIPLVSSLANLEGKTIGLMWTLYTNGDVLANMLKDLLGKRFKNLEFVELPPGKGRQWGNYPDNATIGEVVKESGVDALIVTMGC